ncbi:MAG: DUF4124 domain-containing protein [Candidatus Thiodiazotropha sp. (ex Lucinoma kastoroae)]|nr:DUF4124 domain-containing protein [Candidatus Thiodiazotropha sp. (ex Rostrolucina anterorostrata)]MCU7850025.1 DUF4124 domain-containing protein [Candidatus Thiodiazotropha sp. (ex Lucinoma kastoroae)]
MKILIWGLLILAGIGANLSVADAIFRWRDKNGKVYFGDRPPASIEYESVTVKPNVYHSPNIEKLSQEALSNEKVVMYSAKWCGYCKKARRYFKNNSISFVEYDVESSAKGKRDYKKLGAGGVPIILVGKRRLNGFSEASFRNIYRDEL